jgi:RNA polymerase sigma-70 factor, ECF subfamily
MERGRPSWNWPYLRTIALREAQRTLGRSAAADDAAQETLVRAWRHRSTCRAADQPEAWLRSIARREALRLLAAREPPVITERPAADHSEAVEARVDVARAMKRLSARERDVVVRHYWHDMSCEEIARELACPLGTIKVRLHRARHKLGAALEPR